MIEAGEMLDYPYFEDMVKWRAARTEFVRDITEKAKKGVNEHE
jgi:hypothetical protein